MGDCTVYIFGYNELLNGILLMRRMACSMTQQLAQEYPLRAHMGTYILISRLRKHPLTIHIEFYNLISRLNKKLTIID